MNIFSPIPRMEFMKFMKLIFISPSRKIKKIINYFNYWELLFKKEQFALYLFLAKKNLSFR